MKSAVLDLGTNTFHLLAVNIQPDGSMEMLEKKQYVVKLGEGTINSGIISERAFERGILAFAAMSHSCTQLGIPMHKVSAFATSGIRSASNGKAFIDTIFEYTGVCIRIISGDEEAAYIFEGVKQTVSIPENYLVMDIGGGSVEFIIGRGGDMLWRESFMLGAARLRDKFHQSEPINPNDTLALENHLAEALGPLQEALKIHPCKILVGAAGSFETLLLLSKNRFGENLSMELDIPQYKNIHAALLDSTPSQRMAMPGIISFRIEMIVVASILVNYVMNNCGINQLIASKYSLKEGVLGRVTN
ncbi:MAG: exopolyphosphatase [Flavobacteriaceae bacterium]|nr:exopolyphosphatase [Flavobacteriaceae bacterium]